jgi:uncharacterized tellurite resistance protein B-like protein
MSEATSQVVEANFKTPPISSLEWERHRELIKKLYIVEGRTLRDVIGILRAEHDFQAT